MLSRDGAAAQVDPDSHPYPVHDPEPSLQALLAPLDMLVEIDDAPLPTPLLGQRTVHALGGVPHASVYAHAIAVTVAFILITYLDVVLGEVVPKSLALQRMERVALAVADRDTTDRSVPNIVLSTAHPAKFPDAIERAIGARPRLPAEIAARLEGAERFTVLENDASSVAAFIADRARAARV